MSAPRFLLPPNATIDLLALRDGARVRTLHAPISAPRATALVLTGRADFLEKWAPALADLQALGLFLLSFDWRGQGGSTRTGPPGLGHIDSFDTWLDDLDEIGRWAESAAPPGPRILIAHSMGAQLALRWLARQGRPSGWAPRASILTAPLVGLAGTPWRRALAFAAARRAVARGKAMRFAWGQGPYGALQRSAARQRLLTACPERFADEGRWIDTRPDLAVGGVSWGWLDALRCSIEALEAAPLDTLAHPVLALLAQREVLVSNRAARRLLARLPLGAVETVEGAAHELLREAAGVRSAVLGRIDRFLTIALEAAA